MKLADLYEATYISMKDLDYAEDATLRQLVKWYDNPNHVSAKEIIGHLQQNYEDEVRDPRNVNFSFRDMIEIFVSLKRWEISVPKKLIVQTVLQLYKQQTVNDNEDEHPFEIVLDSIKYLESAGFRYPEFKAIIKSIGDKNVTK